MFAQLGRGGGGGGEVDRYRDVVQTRTRELNVGA